MFGGYSHNVIMLMPWAEAVSLPKAQRLIVTREVFYVLFVVCKPMLAGKGVAAVGA